MSAEMMAWAKRQKLILGKKSVLFMLANYCDEKNSCYPSYQTLADDCGFKDPKSVQRIIKQLEEEGYLRREARFLPKGGQTSNRYFLLPSPHHSTALPPTSSQPPDPKHKPKSNILDGDFEKFWKAYPRKENKDYALKCYQKILKENEDYKNLIVKSVKIFAEQTLFQKTETKFIPMASTWLNQKRFLDKIEKVKLNKNNLAG